MPAPIRLNFLLAVGLFAASLSGSMAQTPVALQNATATFSQSGFTVDTAINGTAVDNSGWAIDPAEGSNQTAAFETVSDAGNPGGSLLTFTLTQAHSNPGHLLGRFRFSVTTDACSFFADGLTSGGDVTANWTVLAPSTVASLNGATLSILGDGSVLSGGSQPATDIYTVTAPTGLSGITGIRLEALTDPSLPVNGPGRFPNGNFVLSEFGVGIADLATPEPGAAALLGAVALAGFGFWKRKRR